MDLEGTVFTIFLNSFDSRVSRLNSQAALTSYISREMMELSIQSCAGDILISYSNGFGLKQVTDKNIGTDGCNENLCWLYPKRKLPDMSLPASSHSESALQLPPRSGL
jgi:hypothetical protein